MEKLYKNKLTRFIYSSLMLAVNNFTYIKDKRKFIESEHTSKKRFDIKDEIKCLNDKTSQTPFDRHYIYHTAWAARVVKTIAPVVHHDVSSLLYFSTILSAFIPVKFYDYRPAQLNLDNLSSHKADLNKLPFDTDSVQSLSCMHTIEHVGLGRYGDVIDYDGDLKAIQELKRVVAPGGHLLFVTPVGQPKIQYNAHRVYSFSQITAYFSGFRLKEFSLIPDAEEQGGLILNADPALVELQEYACGCFWFIKEDDHC